MRLELDKLFFITLFYKTVKEPKHKIMRLKYLHNKQLLAIKNVLDSYSNLCLKLLYIRS